MSDKQSNFRDRPREQGKDAYREGMGKAVNPYPLYSLERLEWSEGWIWRSAHYPRKNYIGKSYTHKD